LSPTCHAGEGSTLTTCLLTRCKEVTGRRGRGGCARSELLAVGLRSTP
jgi:hypothetical protein